MQNIHTFRLLAEYPECVHLVTQKDRSLEYDFSLALHTDEEPAAILGNRQRIQEQFPEMRFVVANQTHSDHIRVIDASESLGWREPETAVEDCDALITNQRGIMLTVLTADCVPILLLDPIKQVIATVHAGWKGTHQSIVSKTVRTMQEVFDSTPEALIAAIAPSIGECCYEVGYDVAQAFLDDPDAYTAKADGKYMLNLPYINQQQLLKVGVSEEKIEMSHICTACEVEHYFSYRQEQGCSGRFMSMIGLRNS
ncbi:MAG TPA: peptidoglycan editing factor PgeF [Campylobacterales bacterium]|nr:peptidoglycan editing factor PgeF [Campylobacterales bacterium]